MNDFTIRPELIVDPTSIIIGFMRFSKDVLGEFVEDLEDCQEMVIHYKRGSDYHVSNPFNIEVFEAKGGGYNLRYSVNIESKERFASGFIKTVGANTVEVDSADIIGVTCFHHKQPNKVRKTVEYVFGAK